MDIMAYLMDLSAKGYFCSQILIKLALEYDEKENADLVRAMSGLNGGLGFCQKTCGVLTAGACVLGYFAGKGEDEELEKANFNEMVAAYVAWFEELTAEYGSVQCADILCGDKSRQMTVCPNLVMAAYGKLFELLEEGGAL